MSTFPLPTDLQEWGYVTGRLIEQVLDTPADPDSFPEARGASGDVVFAPQDTLVTSQSYEAFVMTNNFVCPLNANGELTTPVVSGNRTTPGAVGVWLPVGVYSVSFPSGGPEEFQINVTAAHTEAAPMVLSEEAGYIVPEGAVTNLILIPSNFPQGHIYSQGPNGEVVPVDPATLGGVTSVNGQTGTVNLSASDVGAEAEGTAAALLAGLDIPENAADVGAEPAGAVAAHVAQIDPHPQYLTEAPVTSVAGRDGDVTLNLADVAGVTPAAIGAPTTAQMTSGDSATLSAAQSHAQGLVDALVNASPATLDTLAEIATALGEDPNFAATMTAELGKRVRVDALQNLTVIEQEQARANIAAAAELVAGQNYLTDAERAKLAAITGTNTGDQTWTTLGGKPSTFPPDTHSHPVAEITATGTPDATTYLRGDGSWATPEGGSGGDTVEPGTVVLSGVYDPLVTYERGDLVKTEAGTFVALETVTGTLPAIPADPFVDDFERPDGPLTGWDVNEGWVISGGQAFNDATDGPKFLVNFGAARGSAQWDGVIGQYIQNVGPVFGYVNSQNYYYLNLRTSDCRIQKVVAGISTELARGPMISTSAPYHIDVSFVGQTITVTGVVQTPLVYVDADPLQGTGWGMRHLDYVSTGYTLLGGFTFTPESSTEWQVIERDFTEAIRVKADAGHTHAISEVNQLQAALDAKSGTEHTHTLDALSDVDTALAATGQTLTFNGTAWVPQDLPPSPMVVLESTDPDPTAPIPGVFYVRLLPPAPAPTITTHPTSASVEEGSPVTFTAAATDADSVQWQFNNADIVGATADSYTIPTAALADAGNYHAVYTNAVGSVTTNDAVLTVTEQTEPPVDPVTWSDDFNRADGPDTNGWAIEIGAGVPTILGGQIYNEGGSGYQRYGHAGHAAFCKFEIDYPAGESQYTGIFLSGVKVFQGATGSQAEMSIGDAGDSGIGTSIPGLRAALAAGGRIGLSWDGTTVRVFANGTEMHATTDPILLALLATTGTISVGMCGTSGTTKMWDNAAVTEL